MDAYTQGYVSILGKVGLSKSAGIVDRLVSAGIAGTVGTAPVYREIVRTLARRPGTFASGAQHGGAVGGDLMLKAMRQALAGKYKSPTGPSIAEMLR
jgi:hypothetical protein